MAADNETVGTATPLESKDEPLVELCGGLVTKRLIRQAPNTEETAPDDSEVFVHYEVFDQVTGEVVDSSRARDCEYHWTRGGGHAGRLWEVVAASMCKGEVADLFCKANMVYPRARRPHQLRPHDGLRVRVELLYWLIESDVVYDGRIKKRRIRKGIGFQMPSDGSLVHVKYVGKLDDDTVIDDHSQGEKLVLCRSDIVEGLEEGIKGMTVNEHSIFRMDSTYAFGPQGDRDLGVPPFSQVWYDVELIAFERGPAKWEMNRRNKLELSEFRRQQGNAYFNSGRFDRAYRRYQQALDLIKYERFGDAEIEGAIMENPSDCKEVEEELDAEAEAALIKQAQQLTVACNNNICAIRLKDKSYGEVISRCRTVLKVAPDNTKALYRYAVALMESAQSDEALKQLDHALEVEPDSALFKSMRQKALLLTRKAAHLHRLRYSGWCSRARVGDDRDDSAATQSAPVVSKELDPDDTIHHHAAVEKVVNEGTDKETIISRLVSSEEDKVRQ